MRTTMSAPENPLVFWANKSRFTFGSSLIPVVFFTKSSLLPFSVGKGMSELLDVYISSSQVSS